MTAAYRGGHSKSLLLDDYCGVHSSPVRMTTLPLVVSLQIPASMVWTPLPLFLVVVVVVVLVVGDFAAAVPPARLSPDGAVTL